MRPLLLIYSLLLFLGVEAKADSAKKKSGVAQKSNFASDFRIFAQTYFAPGVSRKEVLKYLGKPLFSEGDSMDWYRLSKVEAAEIGHEKSEIYLRISYINNKVSRTENIEARAFRVFPPSK